MTQILDSFKLLATIIYHILQHPETKFNRFKNAKSKSRRVVISFKAIGELIHNTISGDHKYYLFLCAEFQFQLQAATSNAKVSKMHSKKSFAPLRFIAFNGQYISKICTQSSYIVVVSSGCCIYDYLNSFSHQ